MESLGLQDTNLARIRATQDYLMRCDNVLIVAKISRAVTDRSLQSSLFSAFSRHVPQEWEESAASSLNIAVVCTKSDVSRGNSPIPMPPDRTMSSRGPLRRLKLRNLILA